MLHNDQINHVVLVVKPAVNLAVNSATPIIYYVFTSYHIGYVVRTSQLA